MAYLHDIIEGIMDEVAQVLEATEPTSKPSERWRRQSEQSRMTQTITELTGKPRLFEFDRDSLRAEDAFAGADTIHYIVTLPIMVAYPTASGWHASALDDWAQAFRSLADNATSVAGVDIREIDLSSPPSIQRVDGDPWMIHTWIIRANVNAQIA